MTALPVTARDLARFIDHTALKPEALASDVDRLCDEAREYQFAAVCVNSYWVPRCVDRLRGTEIAVASVAGFPLGAASTSAKAAEARDAVRAGASEIDMVVNLGELLSGQTRSVTADIASVVDAVRGVREQALLKVILETRALTHEQIIAGCRCVAEAQADFVKTSTGFHAAGGATVEHVRLLHKHAAPIRVKASGGIRDLPTALAMIEAGASRLGMSASVGVMQAFRTRA